MLLDLPRKAAWAVVLTPSSVSTSWISVYTWGNSYLLKVFNTPSGSYGWGIKDNADRWSKRLLSSALCRVLGYNALLLGKNIIVRCQWWEYALPSGCIRWTEILHARAVATLRLWRFRLRLTRKNCGFFPPLAQLNWMTVVNIYWTVTRQAHSILTKGYCPHLTDEETETQGVW